MAMTITQAKATSKPGTYAIEGRTGLCFRRYPSGQTSFLWRGKFRDDEVWLALEEYKPSKTTKEKDHYLAQIARIKELIARGIDPRNTDATVGVPTFSEAWTQYVESVTFSRVSDSYQASLKGYWRRDIEPHIGSCSISSLTPTQAHKVVERLRKAGNLTTANRVRAAAHKFWRWLSRRWPEHITGGNPFAAVELTPEEPLEHSLTPEELAKLGKAWLEGEFAHREILLWQLLVGSRRGLIGAYDPSWKKTETILMLPKDVAGAKGARHIVMGPVAAELFKQAKLPVGGSALNYALDRWCKAAGVPKFGSHVLRKTYGTYGQLVTLPTTVDALQNHMAGKVTRAYQQYPLAVLQAMESDAAKIEAKLLELLGLNGLGSPQNQEAPSQPPEINSGDRFIPIESGSDRSAVQRHLSVYKSRL